MSTTKLLAVAPALLVRDLHRAATHYEECMGFAAHLYGEPPTFAIVERDGVRLCLSQVDEGTEITPNWKVQSKSNNAFFWVEDAEALYREFQERGAHIDWELYDTPWGFREFGIQDIDGYDIAFRERA